MKLGLKAIISIMCIILIGVFFISVNRINVSYADDDEEIIDISPQDDEEEEDTDNEVVQEMPSTDLLAPSGVTHVSSINNISSMNLSLNNILLIILIPIGILLILFAIAILIRLKK